MSSQLDALTSRLLKRDFWVGLLQGGGASGADSTKRYTLEELKLRCETLERNPVVTDANRAVVVQTLRSIAEFMIYGDQQEPQVYDFFAGEYNIMAYIQRILQQPQSRMGETAQQVLQTLSIIAQNVSSERALDYLLSNNHVNSIVETPFDFEDEEVLGFYVSFLKAVSLKLTPSTLQLLLQPATAHSGGAAAPHQQHHHQRHALPLYSEAIKFAHHKESLVRAGVRTLTLNVYALHNATVTGIVTAAPASSYFAAICGYMADLIRTLTRELGACVEGFSQQALASLDSPLAEMEDMVSYCSDVLATAHSGVAHVFAHTLWDEFVVPHLLTPLASFPQGADAGNASSLAFDAARPYTMRLYTLERLFSLVAHAPLLNNLALALLGCQAAGGADVLLRSCRHNLAQLLQTHHAFCGAGAVRLLAAVRACRHLSPDVRAALGLPPAPGPARRAGGSGNHAALEQRPWCWCFLHTAEGSDDEDAAALLTQAARATEPLSRAAPPWRYWPQWDHLVATPSPAHPNPTPPAPPPQPPVASEPAAAAAAASAAPAPPTPPAGADLLIQFSEEEDERPPSQPQQPESGADGPLGAADGASSSAGDGNGDGGVVLEVDALLEELVTQAVSAALQHQHQQQEQQQQGGPPLPEAGASPGALQPLQPAPPPECRACKSRAPPRHLGDDLLAALLVLLGNPHTSALSHSLAGQLLLLHLRQPHTHQHPHPHPHTNANTATPNDQALLLLDDDGDGGAAAAAQQQQQQRAANGGGAGGGSAGAAALDAEQRQLLASALTKAAANVGEQLEHCWPDAFFPLFHLEYQQQRHALHLHSGLPGGSGGAGGAPAPAAAAAGSALQASADQLVTGEVARCGDARLLESLGLGATAVHALQLCHAVQHFVAVLLLCQACGVLVAQEHLPGSLSWMLSEMEQAWTEVLEGQQVMLSKANSISCQVCFVPPDPIRVSLAVAGDASDAVLVSSRSLAASQQQGGSPRRAAAALAYSGVLARSSPTVVLAQCANNCVDAGIVVSTAPLLGSRFYQDPKVAVWMHVLVRPSVQSLVKQVRKSAQRKGGLLTCLRNLADGHWILQFKDGPRVLEGLRLVESASRAASEVYKEVVGRRFVNGWLGALYYDEDEGAGA